MRLNNRLGTYTNFVNLLDLCGLAIPAAMRADGTPFGITLLAPAGDHSPGGNRRALPPGDRIAARRTRAAAGYTGVASSHAVIRRSH